MAKNEKKPLLSKSTLMIRLIAGAYLIYLAYELLIGVNVENGAPIWLAIIAAVAFAVCGIILVFFSGKDFLKGNYQGGIMDPSGDETLKEKKLLDQESESTEKFNCHEGK